MRACRRVCFAGIGALALGLNSASLAIAAEPNAEPEKAVAAAGPAKDDYYTRRAKTVLEAEKSRALAPHPLAASYPGMDVVVCEAGCPEGEGAHIVFLRPLIEPRESMMQPTAATADGAPGAASSAKGIDCVAGCYDERQAAYVPPEPVGPWDTKVSPAVVRDKLSPVR